MIPPGITNARMLLAIYFTATVVSYLAAIASMTYWIMHPCTEKTEIMFLLAVGYVVLLAMDLVLICSYTTTDSDQGRIRMLQVLDNDVRYCPCFHIISRVIAVLWLVVMVSIKITETEQCPIWVSPPVFGAICLAIVAYRSIIVRCTKEYRTMTIEADGAVPGVYSSLSRGAYLDNGV
jgi:hypothetical protein